MRSRLSAIPPCKNEAIREAAGPRSLRGARKGDEEGVALVVDLVACMPLEAGAQELAVLIERISVALAAEQLQQPGRALDVAEEEGDGARWLVGHLRRRLIRGKRRRRWPVLARQGA